MTWKLESSYHQISLNNCLQYCAYVITIIHSVLALLLSYMYLYTYELLWPSADVPKATPSALWFVFLLPWSESESENTMDVPTPFSGPSLFQGTSRPSLLATSSANPVNSPREQTRRNRSGSIWAYTSSPALSAAISERNFRACVSSFPSCNLSLSVSQASSMCVRMHGQQRCMYSSGSSGLSVLVDEEILVKRLPILLVMWWSCGLCTVVSSVLRVVVGASEFLGGNGVEGKLVDNFI